MGIVYLAYDPYLDREVAIKVLAPHLVWEEGFVERFLREARAAARLDHPNLVTIYDVGQQDDLYYFVMEYVQGQDLTGLIRKGEAGSADTALAILNPLADAIDYAHRRKLVHRDIKPANILVDSEGKAKLTDFGIAKAAQETGLTATGGAIGTPEYMSPEQARGEEVGPATDSYSLAIVAYEMLSGQTPFGGTTPLAVLHKQIYEPPVPIRDLGASLPPGVDRVLGAALSKDPASRYESLTDFVADLARALAGETPILPAPMSAMAATATYKQRAETGTPPGTPPAKSAPSARRLPPWVLILMAVLAIAIAILVIIVIRGSTVPEPIVAPTPLVKVITATRPEEVEPSHSPAPTETLSPTSTSLPTDTPPATETIEPTKTQLPATPTASVTRPASPTATKQATAVPSTPEPTRAAASASPAPADRAVHPAPDLAEPQDGATYSGCKEQITFRWTSVGDLAEDEYYALSIDHNLGTDEIWTKKADWSIQDIDPFMDKSHNYLCSLKPTAWYVLVKRQTGASSEGQPSGPARGAVSQKRTITWAPSADPGKGGYPTPSDGYLSGQASESPVQAVGFAIVTLSAVLGIVVSRSRSGTGRSDPN